MNKLKTFFSLLHGGEIGYEKNIVKGSLNISLYIIILALHGTLISQRPELV